MLERQGTVENDTRVFRIAYSVWEITQYATRNTNGSDARFLESVSGT